MNVAELVLRVKRDFGDEYDVIITDADVYRWIYAGEMEIIRNTGMNVLSVTAAANTFPENVPLAVQIIRVSRAGRTLLRTTIEEIDTLGLNPGQTGSNAQYWYLSGSVSALLGQTVNLWPMNASDTENIMIDYVKVPVVITGPPPSPTTLTVPEVWHTDLVNFVLARAFEKRGSDSKAKNYQDMFDKNMGNRQQEADSVDAPIYKGGDPMNNMDWDCNWL